MQKYKICLTVELENDKADFVQALIQYFMGFDGNRIVTTEGTGILNILEVTAEEVE